MRVLLKPPPERIIRARSRGVAGAAIARCTFRPERGYGGGRRTELAREERPVGHRCRLDPGLRSATAPVHRLYAWGARNASDWGKKNPQIAGIYFRHLRYTTNAPSDAVATPNGTTSTRGRRSVHADPTLAGSGQSGSEFVGGRVVPARTNHVEEVVHLQ